MHIITSLYYAIMLLVLCIFSCCRKSITDLNTVKTSKNEIIEKEDACELYSEHWLRFLHFLVKKLNHYIIISRMEIFSNDIVISELIL